MKTLTARLPLTSALAGTAQRVFVLGALTTTALAATWLSARTMLRPELLPADELVTGSIAPSGGIATPILVLGAVVPLGLALWVARTGRLRPATRIASGLAAAIFAALAATQTLPTWVVGLGVGLAIGAFARFPTSKGMPASADGSDDIHLGFDAEGDALPVSQALAARLGLAPDEVAGTGLFERVHVQDRVAFRKALSDAASGRASHCRIRLSGPAHPVRTFEMTASPAKPDEPGATMVALRDVSGDVERIEALELACASAEEASRAKSRFIAVASHELRTPLNAILGFADLLRLQDGPHARLSPEKRREYAELVHRSGEHLLGVVNDLLDMSRIEAGRLELSIEPIAIADPITCTIEMLAPLAEARNVRLTNLVDRALPEIEADPGACRQILINLVSNALKHAPDGTSVTVGATRRGDMIEIRVADLGAGMSADELERLGEPFMQLGREGGRETAAEGAGLGFSIVKGLVDLHGGSIAVRSIEAPRAGHGTDVTIKLPIRHEVRAQAPRVVRLGDHNQSGRDASASNRSKEYGRVSA